MGMRADRPALRVQPRGDTGEEGHDLTEDGGHDEAPILEEEVNASTPEVRRLHALIVQLGRHRSLKNPLASVCEELQLTPTQMHALGWLGEEGPLHVGVLAQRIGITRKTITGVVDRLEVMGLVERTRDMEDRRAVVVRLTARGEQSYRRITRGVDASMRRLLDLMETEDRESFFGIIERMLKRLAPKPSSGTGSAQAG